MPVLSTFGFGAMLLRFIPGIHNRPNSQNLLNPDEGEMILFEVQYENFRLRFYC
jgi:hypothetical protein